jgi:hypothetical protein
VFSAYNDIPGEPYDSEDVLPKTLRDLRVHHSKTILLEVKEPGQTWPTWDPEAMCLRVVFCGGSPEDPEISKTQHTYVPKKANIQDMLEAVASDDLPLSDLRVVKEAATVYYGGSQKPFKILWQPPSPMPADVDFANPQSENLDAVFGKDSEIPSALEYNYGAPQAVLPDSEEALLKDARNLFLQGGV